MITGKYKGRHFDVPRTFKGHPTTDFAKENLFNVLKAYVDFTDATCLDLFAGTGSITLEMLSRGAQEVVCVEKEREHMLFIRRCLATLQVLNCTTLCGDAFRYIKSCQRQFDFIFADPPYDLPTLRTLPDLILDGGLLADEGVFVLEHGKNNNFAQHPRFVQQRVYGKVNLSIFR